jgi:hypothetical protein
MTETSSVTGRAGVAPIGRIEPGSYFKSARGEVPLARRLASVFSSIVMGTSVKVLLNLWPHLETKSPLLQSPPLSCAQFGGTATLLSSNLRQSVRSWRRVMNSRALKLPIQEFARAAERVHSDCSDD